MNISKNIKIKCDVTAENTEKIITCMTEQFEQYAAAVDVDDQNIAISTIKAGLSNMHQTDANVKLIESKDGKSYTIKIDATSKLTIVFWIGTVISLFFLPLLLADIGIVFYNKSQIEKTFDNVLNSIKDEF